MDTDFVFITYIRQYGTVTKMSDGGYLMGPKRSELVAPFHFCLNIGDYTGISAASFEDFVKSIKQVKATSLSFHIQRGDFQKWVLEMFKDEKLAKKLENVKDQKLRGQALRNRLHRIVSERLKESTK
ncbi:MAG: hypothetical protein JSV57_03860 [Candidatus Bathyarchaeota archaeon]|nr:MAG: hypothetical protein JSV57_03860 [Candidatus Bathyarchaeota archaeon]